MMGSITKEDLISGRVGLVIAGGGAKGAYQVGVWTALWRNGIHHFSTISGTSVGALNALLIATLEPPEVEKIWYELVAEGILQHKGKLTTQLLGILAGYLLVFFPGLVALVLAFWLNSGPDVTNPYFGLVGAIFIITALVINRDAAFLMRGMERGIVLAFVAQHIEEYQSLAKGIGLIGVAIVWFEIYRGNFELSWWEIFALVAINILSFWLMIYGQQITHRKFVTDPLFSREPLQREIRLRCSSKDTPHCTGAVLATLGRLITFDSPFRVNPVVPDPKSGFDGPPLLQNRWRYHRRSRVTEWAPYYVDLKAPGDTAWALEATSAIPFVFSAIIREEDNPYQRKTCYVDGGVIDNMPLTPLLSSDDSDVILVLGCNHYDELPSQAKIEKIWRSHWLSTEVESEKVDAVRARLRKEPYAELELAPSASSMNVALLKPSRAVVKQWGIPGIDSILDALTGTLRFNPDYVKELIELGDSDTQRWLDGLDRASFVDRAAAKS